MTEPSAELCSHGKTIDEGCELCAVAVICPTCKGRGMIQPTEPPAELLEQIDERAHTADNASHKKVLYEIRAECKRLTGHRMAASWDGFDRCEICGEPGEWETR